MCDVFDYDCAFDQFKFVGDFGGFEMNEELKELIESHPKVLGMGIEVFYISEPLEDSIRGVYNVFRFKRLNSDLEYGIYTEDDMMELYAATCFERVKSSGKVDRRYKASYTMLNRLKNEKFSLKSSKVED